MDFSLSEDQSAIAELAQKIFLDQVTDTAQAQQHEYFDDALWQTLASAGLVGVGLSEANGGSGMGFIAQCLVLKHMGTVLAQVPLLETLLAAQAIEEAGVVDTLAKVAAGEGHLSLSLAAGLTLDNSLVSGELMMVPYAEGAQYIVVQANSTLLAVSPDCDAVLLTPQRVSNGRSSFMVTLNKAPCTLLGDADAIAALQQRQQVATAMVQLGVAEEALRRTALYTTERTQFGKPIAAFQAVAHRAADAYIDIEALRSVIDGAMWRLDSGADASLQAGAARWWANETSHRVSHTAQHLHGGIGADVEYPLHRYFLWAKQLEFDLGGASQQLAAMGRHLARHDQSGITL
ncbi:acyl-CoA dehydrogenase [Kineobactrum sediminis]|uniref:Acyl-CoA dehydrogenase n=1 Tax=Kineobactrum sediminis TaxID=1905677 RepID=A0A2N5Y0G7_9GAMM|nr:acyl-CoA dehydrogenase family protein [Kineobactrum sediminis]PLW81890.1 acyl-CoA dehydrogenase [Kineobactrum sediminis]